MWDFDGDEWAFFLFSALLTVVLFVAFYRRLIGVHRFICGGSLRLLMGIVPIVCLIIVLETIVHLSDIKQVRGHIDYETLFMAGGSVWVFGTCAITSLVNISFREDVLQRNNPAAGIVLAGAMLGNSLCYAGSNIGQGPTIWTTIVPAIVASAALFACWYLIEMITRASESVTIEQDIKSAALLALFLTLAGGNFGWAMAGDWESWAATMDDFYRRAWPAVGLMVMTIIALRLLRPRVLLRASP